MEEKFKAGSKNYQELIISEIEGFIGCICIKSAGFM
jgi:hypothetical protein